MLKPDENMYKYILDVVKGCAVQCVSHVQLFFTIT